METTRQPKVRSNPDILRKCQHLVDVAGSRVQDPWERDKYIVKHWEIQYWIMESEGRL